ncbi:MAG TPA: hypothetical protein VNO51_06740 [Ilumatobacteraceae bacterium]|nr:hypothetical protein [Ilumatobacteraceae bacterium]
MSSELPPPKPGDRAPHRGELGPNYAVRRAIVAGAAVVVTAVAVAAAVIAIRGEQEGDERGVTTWNAVALVSRVNGAVRVVDEDGEEIATVRGTGRVDAVFTSGDRMALVGATQIALVGLDGADPIVVPIEQGSTVSRVATSRSFTLVVSPAASGNLTLIDATDGTQLDVGALAEQTNPMLLADSIRADSDGTAFAIGDGRNFQTVVVRFGQTDATFFPDVPMAVADDLIVTSQTVGRSAELGLFGADGERRASVASEERPIGGLVDGERFVFVSETGAIFEATADDDSPRRLGVIALPTGDVVQSVWPALDGTRFVAAGGGFLAIVDLDGTTLFQTTFTTATATLTPTPTWRCVPVGGSGVFTSLVDLRTGDTVADLQGADVTGVSADGCGVETTGDGGRSVVTPIGNTVLPAAVSTAWIAPDASAAVLVDTASIASLVRIDAGRAGDDGDAEPVELGEVDGLVAFLDR